MYLRVTEEVHLIQIQAMRSLTNSVYKPNRTLFNFREV